MYKKFNGMADTAVRMMLRVPYMMVLYYSMTVYEDETIPTLAVNGVSVWVNPKFWQQLGREQKLTAIAHEVFHKMLLHPSRRGARDPWIWNEAGDYYINARLTQMGFMPLENMVIDGEPWNWLYQEKYADLKWTTESIYDDIVKEREARAQKLPPKNGQGKGKAKAGNQGAAGSTAGGNGPPVQQPGAGGSEAEDGEDDEPAARRPGSIEAQRNLGPLADVRDFGTGPNGEADNTEGSQSVEQFEERVRKELKEAEAQAKMRGNTPGWMERVIGKAFHAKAHWYDVLYEHLKSMSRADYSWKRWNKREFIKTGCLSPDMYQPAMGGVLKFIDTSGSITGRELGLYDKHMRDVLEQVKPKWVAIAYWDTCLHRLDRFDRHEYDVDTGLLRPVGGGGTDFTRWQEVIDDLEEQPDVILAYTDMCAFFPAQEYSVPIVWLSTSSRSEAPFGTLININ